MFRRVGKNHAILCPKLAENLLAIGSSGRNVEHFVHVAVSGGDCVRRTATILTRTQIWRVPVPPVIFGVRLFVVIVVFRLQHMLILTAGACSQFYRSSAFSDLARR